MEGLVDGEKSPWYHSSFHHMGECFVEPERLSRWEGDLEPLPAAAGQPLAACPMQLFKGPQHQCSLPSFHAAVGLRCQEWAWTEQYLLCSAALPPAEGQILGGRKGLEITLCLFARGGSEVSAWPRCVGCNSSFVVAHLSCFQSNKLSTAEK